MRDIRTFSNRRLMVSPSVLAADFAALGAEAARAESAGADMLHLDVMDGHMVPNISFGPPVIKSLRKVSGLLFDTHLMISRPARYAEAFAEAGSDHLTFHLEADDRPEEAIRAIRATGCTVGISLKPATPPEAVFPYLEEIDLVLVMTVEPGFGGQSFMPDQMPKVNAIRREITRRGLAVQLEVDGGIADPTVRTAAEAGANLMVAGTSVFRHPAGIVEAIRRIHEAQSALDANFPEEQHGSR